jgi:hypothetical protein
MSTHPAAKVFDLVVAQVDRTIGEVTPEQRSEFWLIFAAKTMGLIAAQLGHEQFNEFLEMTKDQADELFESGRQTH